MNDQTVGGIASAPEEQALKRKRGRPPKDNIGNSAVVEESNEYSDGEQQNVAIEENLLGQTVSGVLSGSFDAGYFVTVKPENIDITLTGLVFCPEKVIPITPDNDLAPKEIMYKRISPVNDVIFQTPRHVDRDLDIQVGSTSASKSESKNDALMVACDQENDAYEFQMGSYYTPVENLQDYRIVDHDEIMKEFEASACMNAPSASASIPQNVYTEDLSTPADPCLKLMDSKLACSGFTQTMNRPSEAVASFDVNEKPSIDDTMESLKQSDMLLDSMDPIRSDLQLGFTEANFFASANVHHSSTKDIPTTSVEKKNHPDKPSEPPFFFNLTDISKKSVTESLSFTLGNSQETLKINEAVSSELKLSAASTITPKGSIPSDDAPRT